MANNDGSSAVGCGIVLLIAAAWGWNTYSHHQAKIKAAEQTRIEEKKKAEQIRVDEKKKADAAAQAARDEQAAIELAKRAHTIVGDWPPTTKANAELLTNDYQVRRLVSRMTGDMKIIGWRATKYDDSVYVVAYMFERAGASRGWPFEVNSKAGVVRKIIGDAELEQKYGWGDLSP